MPAAGMGPCGSPRGWQRSQGRNLTFSRTPGSVFLLSIFLKLTSCFSRRAASHTAVLSRGVWTIWFFRHPDKTGPRSIGQKAAPRNLTKARTITIMLKARDPKGHRPVLWVTRWPLSSPGAYPCSYPISSPDVPERTTFSNMSDSDIILVS